MSAEEPESTPDGSSAASEIISEVAEPAATRSGGGHGGVAGAGDGGAEEDKSSRIEVKPRLVFISASRLARQWKSVPSDVLRDALFFFGSKRRWLFPSTDEERKESRAQPGEYHRMDRGLRDLILEKEGRNEVWFLKRDDLAYTRYPGPPDHAAFGRASTWLAGLGYNPLRVDKAWWGKMEKRSRTFKYCKKVDRIVANIERGYHEYDEVRELIAQSDARLLPVLQFSRLATMQLNSVEE